MENEFKIYFEYALNQIELNAWIILKSKENKRNFLDDPYYRNYDRFTPVLPLRYHSFEEWRILSVNTSQLKNEYTQRFIDNK